MTESVVGRTDGVRRKMLAPRLPISDGAPGLPAAIQKGGVRNHWEAATRRRSTKPRSVACQSCRQAKVRRPTRRSSIDGLLMRGAESYGVRILPEGHVPANVVGSFRDSAGWTRTTNVSTKGCQYLHQAKQLMAFSRTDMRQ